MTSQSNTQPLCIVLIASGKATDDDGGVVDFDAVYDQLIQPALQEIGIEPIRADLAGERSRKALYDQLLLCEYVIADLTVAEAAACFAIGARHAVRPHGTVLLSAAGRPSPVDVGSADRLIYNVDEQGAPADPEGDRRKLGGLVREASARSVDRSLLNLLEGRREDEPDHMRTDRFRHEAEYSKTIKRRLTRARKEGEEAVAAVEDSLGPLDEAEAGSLIDLMLSYRAVKGWQRMIDLIERMPEPLRRTVMVREQYAFALNRTQRSEEAERVLNEVLQEIGPSSETWGLLGRVYKDRWEAAMQAGREAAAKGFLTRAVDAYLQGFETDWRDTYPGINAATLMELMEPPDPRRNEIRGVVEYGAKRRTAKPDADYWDWATLLEARILARDEAGAREALAQALARMREPWEPETTARNVQLIRQAWEQRGEDTAWVREIERELTEAKRDATPAASATAPEETEPEPTLAQDGPAIHDERPAEVLVIGSGLGGGVLAWALAETRIDVLQVERGEYRGSHPGNHTRYDGSAELGYGHDATPFADQFRDDSLSISSSGEFKHPLRSVMGGGTLAWGALSVRMQRYEFDPWPDVVRDQLMARFYDDAAERLRVRGVPFPSQEPFMRVLRDTLPFHHPDLAPIAFGATKDPSPDSPRKFCAADPLWDLIHVAQPDSRSRRYRLRAKHEAVRLHLDSSGKKVTGVEVRNLDEGRNYLMKADRYVLAAGPIESAAIALRSGLANGEHPGRALIGKGLTDHPVYYQPFEIPYGSTFYEYHQYAKSLALPSDSKSGSHPYNMVLHIGLIDRLRGHVTSGSRYGEVVFLLDAMLSDSNTVSLGEDDRPHVTIDPCPVDDDLHEELEQLASRVIQTLEATPKSDLAVAPLMNVIHHVGSLRMGAGDSGVVNEDLRFGGIENLYVCDGSVLPSSPAANPGLTIAALALRLAEHLQTL